MAPSLIFTYEQCLKKRMENEEEEQSYINNSIGSRVELLMTDITLERKQFNNGALETIFIV